MKPAPVDHGWTPAPGATRDELGHLIATVKAELPVEYLRLLESSNGGEGSLSVRPGWFQLYDVEYAAELWESKFYRAEFPDYFFFGSNGGLESFAFTFQGPRTGSIVVLDAIAGSESALEVASSFAEFIQLMSKPSPSEA